MNKYPVEEFARGIPSEVAESVHIATSKLTAARSAALAEAFQNPDEARERAAEIKAYVLDHLKDLLLELEKSCMANGIHVHWAKNAQSANRTILDICRAVAPTGGVIVKGKSMASEEIHLNPFLEANGYQPVETDLGEYVVQLDHDLPSHIVTPIIHKDKSQISKSFAKAGLGPKSDDPATLALQARERLRAYFREAKIGISGVNFAVADTGRIVLLENEGNNRLSTTAPQVHIALMGIEKVIPREADLPLFLRLLANSATGQQLTSYVHLISGPKQAELDGPAELHLILLDNGRSRLLNGPYRDILRCLRCGACLNVCPVYRQVSGHAYGHVYSGPVGAVLAPAMEGVAKLGALAKASTLCGACEEVCPVRIPIPHMLLRLRDQATREGVISENVPWSKFVDAAVRPWMWRLGLRLLPMAQRMPHPAAKAWKEGRNLPRPTGRNFRSWWNERA